ncbi:MAG: sodium:solute symporter [Bacteroidetes bacterium]|nr:sodium:solute symporter [Bacteroidota bacterium]
MDDFGLLSVLPPLVAIILALMTRQVYISLVVGIWLGWMIISDWNILQGSIATLEGFVDVFRNPGNTRTIMFSALVGALLIFIQYSGGVQGFILRIDRLLQSLERKRMGKSRVVVELFALATGILLFIETSISSLTVGTLYRPIFDRLKIPREKLAYIADSSSAPSSILIPFNAWGAFIMGLLITQGIEAPFSAMLSAMAFNFYPMIALLMVFLVIVTRKDFGPMARAEKRTRETGKLLKDGSRPMVSDEITSCEMKAGVRPRAVNMIIPLLTMIVMMIVSLAYTGWGEVTGYTSFMNHFTKAMGQGSGSSAVLYAVTCSILIAMVMYRVQGIMKIRKMIELILKGISELMPLALLMMLAFSISHVCNSLGTGIYVAGITEGWLSPQLLPAVVFVLSSFIAFSTGTSWGTFAIMISIAVPMARIHDANVFLIIAATMGGGVFGDHCSPISDTTIISSMASASDHIDHVRTQLPYALFTGLLTTMIYLLLGFAIG